MKRNNQQSTSNNSTLNSSDIDSHTENHLEMDMFGSFFDNQEDNQNGSLVEMQPKKYRKIKENSRQSNSMQSDYFGPLDDTVSNVMLSAVNLFAIVQKLNEIKHAAKHVVCMPGIPYQPTAEASSEHLDAALTRIQKTPPHQQKRFYAIIVNNACKENTDGSHWIFLLLDMKLTNSVKATVINPLAYDESTIQYAEFTTVVANIVKARFTLTDENLICRHTGHQNNWDINKCGDWCLVYYEMLLDAIAENRADFLDFQYANVNINFKRTEYLALIDVLPAANETNGTDHTALYTENETDNVDNIIIPMETMKLDVPFWLARKAEVDEKLGYDVLPPWLMPHFFKTFLSKKSTEIEHNYSFKFHIGASIYQSEFLDSNYLYKILNTIKSEQINSQHVIIFNDATFDSPLGTHWVFMLVSSVDSQYSFQLYNSLKKTNATAIQIAENIQKEIDMVFLDAHQPQIINCHTGMQLTLDLKQSGAWCLTYLDKLLSQSNTCEIDVISNIFTNIKIDEDKIMQYVEPYFRDSSQRLTRGDNNFIDAETMLAPIYNSRNGNAIYRQAAYFQSKSINNIQILEKIGFIDVAKEINSIDNKFANTEFPYESLLMFISKNMTARLPEREILEYMNNLLSYIQNNVFSNERPLECLMLKLPISILNVGQNETKSKTVSHLYFIARPNNNESCYTLLAFCTGDKRLDLQSKGLPSKFDVCINFIKKIFERTLSLQKIKKEVKIEKNTSYCLSSNNSCNDIQVTDSQTIQNILALQCIEYVSNNHGNLSTSEFHQRYFTSLNKALCWSVSPEERVNKLFLDLIKDPSAQLHLHNGNEKLIKQALHTLISHHTEYQTNLNKAIFNLMHVHKYDTVNIDVFKNTESVKYGMLVNKRNDGAFGVYLSDSESRSYSTKKYTGKLVASCLFYGKMSQSFNDIYYRHQGSISEMSSINQVMREKLVGNLNLEHANGITKKLISKLSDERTIKLRLEDTITTVSILHDWLFDKHKKTYEPYFIKLLNSKLRIRQVNESIDMLIKPISYSDDLRKAFVRLKYYHEQSLNFVNDDCINSKNIFDDVDNLTDCILKPKLRLIKKTLLHLKKIHKSDVKLCQFDPNEITSQMIFFAKCKIRQQKASVIIQNQQFSNVNEINAHLKIYLKIYESVIFHISQNISKLQEDVVGLQNKTMELQVTAKVTKEMFDDVNKKWKSLWLNTNKLTAQALEKLLVHYLSFDGAKGIRSNITRINVSPDEIEMCLFERYNSLYDDVLEYLNGINDLVLHKALETLVHFSLEGLVPKIRKNIQYIHCNGYQLPYTLFTELFPNVFKEDYTQEKLKLYGIYEKPEVEGSFSKFASGKRYSINTENECADASPDIEALPFFGTRLR